MVDGGGGVGVEYGINPNRISTMKPEARIVALMVFLVALTPSTRSLAWSENEHVRITFEALSRRNGKKPGDDPLKELWEAARMSHPRLQLTLCESIDWEGLSFLRRGRTPCVSFSALAAIAADHSCSAADLAKSVHDPWVHAVLDAAARFDRTLHEMNPREYSAASWRALVEGHRKDLDLRLLAADPRYRSRAGSNRSHFQLPAPRPCACGT
jgi:hypothetical protein